MFAVGLTIAKKTATIAKMTVAAGVANLALALILVPPLGIVGAGIATAVSSIAYFVGLMVAGQRYYAVPHRWVRLSVALVAVTVLVGVAVAVLPSARADALSAGALGVRVILVLVGVGLSIWLSLDADEIGLMVRRLSSAINRRIAGRQPAGAIE